jgi:hypothetical protein
MMTRNPKGLLSGSLPSCALITGALQSSVPRDFVIASWSRRRLSVPKGPPKYPGWPFASCLEGFCTLSGDQVTGSQDMNQIWHTSSAPAASLNRSHRHALGGQASSSLLQVQLYTKLSTYLWIHHRTGGRPHSGTAGSTPQPIIPWKSALTNGIHCQPR